MKRRIVPGATDAHLDHIASLLDDMFQVPGTGIRFGLDFLIGLIPGVGDAVSGIASLLIIVASWRRGAKLITLARMITNVVLETVIGSIPLVGDVFHVVWKANRRNYQLFLREKNRDPSDPYLWRDILFFLCLGGGILLLLAVPIGLVLWCIGRLLHHHPRI